MKVTNYQRKYLYLNKSSHYIICANKNITDNYLVDFINPKGSSDIAIHKVASRINPDRLREPIKVYSKVIIATRFVIHVFVLVTLTLGLYTEYISTDYYF